MLLKIDAVSKAFAGVQALSNVSFDLRAGEVHALIGENGAGKSTLIKIITGAHQADSGSVELFGQRMVANDPVTTRRLGVAAIYQQPALFPDLSVAENIALGQEHNRAWNVVNWRKRGSEARRLLNSIGANIDPNTEVKYLSMPEQQLVEIARALGADARILIMDEPTASLSEREVENLFRVIGELRAKGVGIVYISHRLNELFQIADRVTTLRDGQFVASHSIHEVTRADLIRLMVGRELSSVFPKRVVPIGGVVLRVAGLSSSEVGVHDIDLEVRSGEILGLAGLIGAGRTELARVLFGLARPDRGVIELDGKPVRIQSPAGAVALGIAYVPEDRRRHGVILDMPVQANTTLAVLKKVSTWGWLHRRQEREMAKDYVERLQVKTASLSTLVGMLSGGNQQKIALARWLATHPRVLILDEPTQGIDVGAKAEIHRLMGDLAEQGMAIIMISSELPEVLGMCDRIAVMHGGRIMGTLVGKQATQESIMSLALGHTLAEAIPA